jgi:hypothetical protein
MTCFLLFVSHTPAPFVPVSSPGPHQSWFLTSNLYHPAPRIAIQPPISPVHRIIFDLHFMSPGLAVLNTDYPMRIVILPAPFLMGSRRREPIEDSDPVGKDLSAILPPQSQPIPRIGHTTRQVYCLDLTPLFATLTKTAGVYPVSSHFGTHRLHPAWRPASAAARAGIPPFLFNCELPTINFLDHC